jgi:hypothetical protein
VNSTLPPFPQTPHEFVARMAKDKGKPAMLKVGLGVVGPSRDRQPQREKLA